MAAVRWTLEELEDELSTFQDAPAARFLQSRIVDLQTRVGPGAVRRPTGHQSAGGNAWLEDAVQAMGWIAEERGLGGARVLDGMSWDLPIEEVWESWVNAFVAELAPRCGLIALRHGETKRPISWSTPTSSMRLLIPDSGLRGSGRVVWLDAKYKAHLQLLASRGWSGLEESTRDAHRADLHQALAYAALEDAEAVDSVLVYPDLSPDVRRGPAIASVAAGRRRVRLLLMGLPFGFRSPAHRDATLSQWRQILSA